MNQLYKVSEVKLSYKTKSTRPERVQVSCPQDCYNVLIKHWDKGQLEHKESFKTLLLNRNNVVLGIYTISEGGICGTVFDVRIILQAALLSNATSIVIAHNHPSGNLTPGYNDIEATRAIKEAARVVDITVYDHIIVCKDDYYSFANKGKL
jgi:DNA repair protein RadC